jgi:hypothetical protein
MSAVSAEGGEAAVPASARGLGLSRLGAQAEPANARPKAILRKTPSFTDAGPQNRLVIWVQDTVVITVSLVKLAQPANKAFGMSCYSYYRGKESGNNSAFDVHIPDT